MKAIPGYFEYFADEDGNIYSTRFSRKMGDRMNDSNRIPRKLTPWLCRTGQGYLMVAIRDNAGKKWRRYVHELILETFVGPRPQAADACHGPKGSLNNALDNLYWGYHQRNMMDKQRDGTMVQGEIHPFAKLNDSAVRYIQTLHHSKSSNGMTNQDIADLFGVTPQLISKVAHRVVWKHVA